MKLKKSSLVMILAVVMTLTMAVGGTLAYLTDTERVENKFTLGDVDIELNESYTQGSELMPGVNVNKSAGITNIGKNDAWVIMTVAVPAVDKTPIVIPNFQSNGWTDKGTQEITLENQDYLLYAYVYNKTLAPKEPTGNLLSGIQLDPRVDYNPVTQKYAFVNNGIATDFDYKLDAGKVYVNAFAIQSNGFKDAVAAYDAYVAQWGATNGWTDNQIAVTTPTASPKPNTTPAPTPTVKPVQKITTAEDLKTILTAAGADTGNTIIEITQDVELAEGEVWTPVEVEGYTGTGVITINGNNHTISGLTAPLFAGGFAGASGIQINDLTIADSKIVSTSTQGSGAFIETIDSMPTVTLSNCHLIDSTVTGSRTGGLIGWTAGYNNTNNGAVKTYITIENCSVEGCTINGVGESVGAINGHAGANSWTYTTITNCTIKNNDLTGGSGKTGVIVGTANVGEVTISGCTMENNTINGASSNTVYGRFVPGDSGKLTIDGVAIN